MGKHQQLLDTEGLEMVYAVKTLVKRSKYGNEKITVDGYKFDSKKEARRYQELKLLQKAGEIEHLRLQPKYTLLESFKDVRAGYTKKGKPKVVKGIEYVGDFEYLEKKNKAWVIEDVKSEITRKNPVYRMKIKLLLHLYKDCDFREV